MGFLREQTILFTLPTAASVSLDNHILQFTGSQEIDYRTIQACSGFVTAVAETLQVDTLTPTLVANTEYRVHLRQRLNSGVVLDQNFSYTTTATDTATTLCDNFRTMIDASNFEIDTSGAATLILTAQAGATLFNTTDVGAGTFAVAATTPGVTPEGQGQDLIDAGVDGAVAGQAYDRIDFEYLHTGNNELSSTPEFNKLVVYADNAAAGYAAFNSEVDDIVAAAIAPATEADPETVSLA